jgi:predicted DCC family thiol-disulfide oxidoreductase YuxK
MFARTRPARLFYDGGCGPCTFFARASQGLGRGRIEIVPLASTDADRDLGALAPEVREGSFHLLSEDRLVSGENALVPWLSLAVGRTMAQGVAHVPPARWIVVQVYRRLWEHRRTHGCAAPGRATVRTG